MIRQTIIPTSNTYLLHLPDNYIGKQVEICISPLPDDTSPETRERVLADAFTFFHKNAVDFSTIEKSTREDLYE